MIVQTVSIETWLSLPSPVRSFIRGKFKMTPSAYTITNGEVLLSDGFTEGDLRTFLSLEKINETMGWKEKDLFDAFEKLIKFNSEGEQTNKIIQTNEEDKIGTTNNRPSEEVRIEAKTSNGNSKEDIQSVKK